MLSYYFDFREYHRLRRKSMELLGRGTARAVRLAGDEGADYARRNHIHTRRTGQATSPDNLFFTVTRTDLFGASGILENRAKHAWFIEHRTRPHLILPLNYHWGERRRGGPTSRITGKRVKVAAGVGRGSALRFSIGGVSIFRRSVRHPGTRAMPFMRPASQFAGRVIVRETERVTFVVVAALWE